jgi:hypothetical protein
MACCPSEKQCLAHDEAMWENPCKSFFFVRSAPTVQNLNMTKALAEQQHFSFSFIVKFNEQ